MTRTEERTVPYEIYERLEAENAQLRAENEQYWREQQWIEELLHVDHSVLSASHKVTLIALYRDLPNHGTDPQGWRQIKTYKLVGDTGSSQDTVLSTIERAKRLGLVEKRKRRVDQGDGNYTTDFFLKDLPALYTPARYQETVQDELLRKHGGKQKPKCVNCGSENLDRHEWQHCRSCGYDHFVPLFDDPSQNRQFANTDDEEEQNPQFADIVDADSEEETADFNVGELPTFPPPIPQCPQVANIEETHLIVDTLPDPPSWLRDKKIWCPWRFEEPEKPRDDGKMNKVPYQTHGRVPQRARNNDASTWSSYEEAQALYEEYLRGGYPNPFEGIGLMCDDSFVGIDLDHCRDLETGEWADWAMDIVARFTSYTYVTPSHEGLRIIIQGKKPGTSCKKGAIEIYEKVRFFTWRPERLDGTPETIEACQAELDAFYKEVWPEEPEMSDASDESELKVQIPPYSCSDKRILEKARNGRNGSGEKFRMLYDQGNWSNYPSQSEADHALCSLLAYWSDYNVFTIDRLFRDSPLMRPKWDEKRGGRTYGWITISKALRGIKNRKRQQQVEDLAS